MYRVMCMIRGFIYTVLDRIQSVANQRFEAIVHHARCSWYTMVDLTFTSSGRPPLRLQLERVPATAQTCHDCGPYNIGTR